MNPWKLVFLVLALVLCAFRLFGDVGTWFGSSNQVDVVVVGRKTTDTGSHTTAANNNNNKTKKKKFQLPTIQLIGVQKGGTSALAVWLFYNGNIQRPQTFDGEPFFYDKEVHFFDLKHRYEQGMEFYAARFNHTTTTTTSTSDGGGRHLLSMDATPDTFRFPERVREVYDAAGDHQAADVKILAVLREPIARELSMYNHMASDCRTLPPSQLTNWHKNVLRKDGTIMSFGEFVNEITIPALENGKMGWDDKFGQTNRYGMYASILFRWFKAFDRKQILVLSYEELKNDPDKLQDRVKQFLQADIEPGSFVGANDNSNPHKVKLSSVSTKTKAKLKAIFDPLNEDLYELLEEHPGPPMEQRPFPKF